MFQKNFACLSFAMVSSLVPPTFSFLQNGLVTFGNQCIFLGIYVEGVRDM